MKRHILACLPEEGCGLLGGRGERVEKAFMTTNELHSPARYRMDPSEQLKAFIWLEENGMDLLGIFHSHPNGPPYPSRTDIEESYYPEAVYLIWTPQIGHEWSVKGFIIGENEISEVPLIRDINAQLHE